MIGFISGEVLYSNGNKIILKTASGIGWEVYYSKLVSPGEELQIFTSQIVRENSQELFGFELWEEKEIFELLLGVNGVGPKSAYSLLANLGPKALVNAILLENKKSLKEAPGIGPKAAAQIILSLKDKVEKMSISVQPTQTAQASFEGDENYILQDALMAGRELGFNESMILSKAQSLLAEQEIKSSEELLRKVLQELR